MTSNPLPPLARKPGTVGLGQGVSVRILAFDRDEDVEEGEVSIKGLNVTPGYINNDKANAESFTSDGYFRTGDRGRLDGEGYLILTGRLKELVSARDCELTLAIVAHSRTLSTWNRSSDQPRWREDLAAGGGRRFTQS